MNVSTIGANGAASTYAQAPAPAQPALTVAGPALMPAEPPASAGPPLSRGQLEQAVERANQSLAPEHSVRFAVHEGTSRIVVRILDPQSMEVIREFPDSTFLDMMAKLQELSGLQVDVQT